MIIDDFVAAFISKIVSDGIDCTKETIKDALKRKSKKYSTLDIQMYKVIIGTIKDMASPYIKNDEEKIYDAAEVLLKSIKNEDQIILDKIKMCLKYLCVSPDKENCEEFQKTFRVRILKKENEELRNALDWERSEQCFETVLKIKRNVDSIKSCVEKESLSSNQQKNIQSNNQQNKFQNNKKKIYCDIWNQSMFLQHKDQGRLVRLCDAFIVPNYYLHQYKIWHDEDDTLESLIDKFINYQNRSTMLITGVPGIGKTSIVSWIANKYKENDRVIILRFRDWEKKDLEDGILEAIKNTLQCSKMDLKYKTLILDGFDEIKLLENREELLNGFFNSILDFDFLKCIITSRPHYIQTEKFNNYIELAPFDSQKIRMFYTNIKGKELDGTIGVENIDVYGIPVILYMSIMCGLDITNCNSKPEIYNRIFEKDGGIFDRFSFDEKAYGEGAQILRDTNNIEKYLVFLRETAFQLFKLNGEDLILKKCDIPTLKFEQKNISILEFPLKPLFENIEKIEFIHKSIYEYFVSEYIFSCVNNFINGTKEELADILGRIFKDNYLTLEMLEFLQYRIRSSKLNEMFGNVLDTFNMMLQDGMTYYVSEPCKPIIICEKKIFYNMLELLHSWETKYIRLDNSILNYVLFKNDRIDIVWERMNLSKIDLRGIDVVRADLEGADLSETNLSEISLCETNLSSANLSKADLRGTNLNGANLSGARLREALLMVAGLIRTNLNKADLSYANLNGADLREADLRKADLKGTKLEAAYLDLSIFDEEQINYLEESYKLNGTRVYIFSTKEIISYEEYCKRRN